MSNSYAIHSLSGEISRLASAYPLSVIKGNAMSRYYSSTVDSSEKRSDSTPVFCSVVLILAFSLLSFVRLASAQEDVIGAARAFSRAQKADLAGDYEMAAELFELADSLSPSPEALRSALRSRKAAGQLSTAALHAESLRIRYPYDTKSQELVRDTVLLAKQKLMRFEIECRPRVCTLMVDDAAAVIRPGDRHVIYIKPGNHEVIAAFDDARSDPQFVDAKAGKRGSLLFIYKPNPVKENKRTPSPTGINSNADSSRTDLAAADSGKLSIWYFLSGVAVTAGAGAATLWSGLDVLDLHDEYEKKQTQEMYESGLDRELRTNILIGITAAAGAATCVLALFTQWDDSGESDSQNDLQTSVSVGSNGGLLKIDGIF